MRLSRRALLLSSLAGSGALAVSLPAFATAGKKASAFKLRGVPGASWKGTFDLGNHLGKRPVLIAFFATWCRPCEVELPFMQKLYESHHEKGLEVAAISIDGPETARGIGPMSRRLGLTFPVLHDADSRVGARYNPRNFAPFVVMIDRAGNIVREREGWNPTHEQEMRHAVAALLA